MLATKSIAYEVADRERALSVGGIGLIHRLVQRVGLPAALDARLALLKAHLPYHESDHVLSLAYNILAGGTCLEDLERLRQDEALLDTLGAARLPDPTTAGDFCRRFDEAQVDALQDAINAARMKVWARQDPSFFAEAVIDADGTLVATDGECKEGCDFGYEGTYGYHPLLISLRQTREPLFLLNRSGNRPSQEGAPELLDRALALCQAAGFRKVWFQGDTAFSQSAHLDRWDAAGAGFIFGWDCGANLVRRAQGLPPSAWSVLVRPDPRDPNRARRARPENVKDRVVAEREFTTITTTREEVADFAYQPTACTRAYRMVVLKKTLAIVKGQRQLHDDVRYFFFITNDRARTAGEIVLAANARCDQENLIEQLKNGARALRMPVGDRVSNGAYMVMAALAWSLKAWLALELATAVSGKPCGDADRKLVLRMEFKRFLHHLMLVPAQLVRTGRRVVLRLLAWNPLQDVFLRAADVLERPLRC